MNLYEEEILTDRLLPEPVSFYYAGEIFNEFTDSVASYMFPKPSDSIDGIMSFISSSMEGLKEGNNFQLVILKKSSLEFIGCAGLHHIGSKDPELGIWLKKCEHGNKYGLEAMTALINWAKNKLEFKYLRYPVDRRNHASRRIPESNGGVIMREFKRVNQKGFELDEVEYWIYK